MSQKELKKKYIKQSQTTKRKGFRIFYSHIVSCNTTKRRYHEWKNDGHSSNDSVCNFCM